MACYAHRTIPNGHQSIQWHLLRRYLCENDFHWFWLELQSKHFGYHFGEPTDFWNLLYIDSDWSVGAKVAAGNLLLLVNFKGMKIRCFKTSFFFVAGAAIGLSVMGCYSWASSNDHDLHHFNLVPVVSLSFVIFISSIGIIPIPYIIIAEVLPQKVYH